jgi:hypothetical protein
LGQGREGGFWAMSFGGPGSYWRRMAASTDG